MFLSLPSMAMVAQILASKLFKMPLKIFAWRLRYADYREHMKEHLFAGCHRSLFIAHNSR